MKLQYDLLILIKHSMNNNTMRSINVLIMYRVSTLERYFFNFITSEQMSTKISIKYKKVSNIV